MGSGSLLKRLQRDRLPLPLHEDTAKGTSFERGRGPTPKHAGSLTWDFLAAGTGRKFL